VQKKSHSEKLITNMRSERVQR